MLLKTMLFKLVSPFIGLITGLVLFFPSGQQPNIAYPKGYKTLQDSIFKIGDTVLIQYVFPMDNDLSLAPDSYVMDLFNFMQSHPEFHFHIISHTDTRGSHEANLKLSQFRSASIVKQMVELGIPSAVMTAVGKGETQPIYKDEWIQQLPSNEKKEAAYAINRRTELHLKRKSQITE